MGEIARNIVEYVKRPRVRGVLGAVAYVGYSVSTFFTHSGKDLTESTRVFGICPEGTTVDGADVRHDGAVGPLFGWPVVRFACSDGSPASIHIQQFIDSDGDEYRSADMELPNGHFEAEIDFTPIVPDGQWDIGLGSMYVGYDSTSVVGDGIDINRISVIREGQAHQVWGD